jgi:hypothetical protein
VKIIDLCPVIAQMGAGKGKLREGMERRKE